MNLVKTYSELRRFLTFEERFEYLRIGGGVGNTTFGPDRMINQSFYTSYAWKEARDVVIFRDSGCDLGIPGYEIHDEVLVHHINPMVVEDILNVESWIVDPEYLITTTHRTHNAIHYGAVSFAPKVVTERTPHDTKLW